ncbi:MAG: hypothetical protein BroJett024_44660 [Alphaproteobacteria bacterium]|nr:MAG: hypothetical protein BroJett024_44660 [Alphaproteobacteria bacterium]
MNNGPLPRGSVRYVPLRDVATVIMGQSPPSSTYTANGEGLPFFQGKAEFGSIHPTPVKWCVAPTKTAEPGDVLMSVRAPVGPTNLAIERCCIGRGLAAIRPVSDVRSKWLLYALRAMEPAIENLGTGTTFKAISGETLRQLEVPIADVEQQDHAISEVEKQFSRLDKAVASLRHVAAKLKRQKAAVLKSAVDGTLLVERHAKSWRWDKIGSVAKVISGLTKSPKRLQLPRKLPYLRVANVHANELRLDEIEEIGVADSELEKLLLRRGDLLVVEGNGSVDQIGRVAIWDGSIAECAHQNHLIKVRLSDEVLPEWALIWLLSPAGRQEIEQVSSSTSGLHTLSTGKVARLPIPVPPRAEQHRIVAEVDRRLSIAREVEAEVGTNLKRAQALRQAILSKAFAGCGERGE